MGEKLQKSRSLEDIFETTALRDRDQDRDIDVRDRDRDQDLKKMVSRLASRPRPVSRDTRLNFRDKIPKLDMLKNT